MPPSSSRPEMVGTRSPGCRIPANRGAWGRRIPGRVPGSAPRSARQLAAAHSPARGGQATSSATRRRRRTAFSASRAPRGGLPPSRVGCPGKRVRSGHPWSWGLTGGFLSWLHYGAGAALLLRACFLLCKWKHWAPACPRPFRGCPPVPAQLGPLATGRKHRGEVAALLAAVARVPWPSWNRLNLTKPQGDLRLRGRWLLGKVTQHFKRGVRSGTRVPGSRAGVCTSVCVRRCGNVREPV